MHRFSSQRRSHPRTHKRLHRLTTLLLCLFPLCVVAAPPIPSVDIPAVSETKPPELGKDVLDLMYLSMTYSREFEDAYRVTQRALQCQPESLLWHERAADVCRWSGRSDEAITHLLFLYRHRPTPQLADTIMEYTLETGHYAEAFPFVKAQLLKQPDRNATQRFARVSEETSSIDEAIHTLLQLHREHPRRHLPLQALRLALDHNRPDIATAITPLLGEPEAYDPEARALMLRYYYQQHDLAAAFALSYHGKLAAKSSTELMTLSDLGWALGYDENAAAVAQILMQRDEARGCDLKRIAQVYRDTNGTLATEAARVHWISASTPSTFYTFAHLALDNNATQTLQEQMNVIRNDAELHNTLNTPQYHLIAARLYRQTEQSERLMDALLDALALAPKSPSIRAAVLWCYLDQKRLADLRDMLFSIEDEGNPPPILWLPMASAYVRLGKIDRAEAYIQQLQRAGDGRVDLHDLHAAVVAAQDQQTAAYAPTTYARSLALREIASRMDDNRRNNSLDAPAVQLYEAYAERAQLQSGLSGRATLKSVTIAAAQRTRLASDRTLHLDADYTRHSLKNQPRLATVPEIQAAFNARGSQRFASIRLEAALGFRRAMRDYMNGQLSVLWQPSARWSAQITAGWRDDADETLYTLLGAYKNRAKFDTSYTVTPSSALGLEMEQAAFFAQDGTALGRGNRLNAGFTHYWHVTSADIATTLFFERGSYRETGGSHGEIQTLLPSTRTILPKDYRNTGLTLRYAERSAGYYTRGWRGFAELTPFYSTVLGGIHYRFKAGVGGLAMRHDHLSVGIDYDQAINGTDEFSVLGYVSYALYY